MKCFEFTTLNYGVVDTVLPSFPFYALKQRNNNITIVFLCFLCRWYGCAYCAGKNKSFSVSRGNGLTTVWRQRAGIRDGPRCRPLAWCRTRGPSLREHTARWRRRTCRCCSDPTAFSGVNTPNRSLPAGRTRSMECPTIITGRYATLLMLLLSIDWGRPPSS